MDTIEWDTVYLAAAIAIITKCYNSWLHIISKEQVQGMNVDEYSMLFNSAIVLKVNIFPSSGNNWCLFTPMRIKVSFFLHWDEGSWIRQLISCKNVKSDNVMLRFRQPNKTEKGKQLPAPLKLSVIGFSRPKECHHNLVSPKNAFPDDFLSLCSYFFATVNVCFFRLE